jgi:hypothetical protein
MKNPSLGFLKSLIDGGVLEFLKGKDGRKGGSITAKISLAKICTDSNPLRQGFELAAAATTDPGYQRHEYT